MTFSAIVCLLLVGAGETPEDAKGPASSSAKDLLNRMVLSRRNLNQGHLRIKSRFEAYRGNPNVTEDTYNYQVVFANNSVFTKLDLVNPRWSKHIAIVLTEKESINDWDSEQLVEKQTRSSKQPSVKLQHAFDPRLIGLATCSLSRFYKHDLATIYSRLDEAESFTVVADRIDDLDVRRVEYTVAGKLIHKFWICPGHDYNPMRIEIWDGEKIYIQVTSSYLNDSIHISRFPRVVTYRQFKNNVVDVQETLEVLDADFSSPVPAETFTIQSLNLKPGRGVIDDSEMMTWTGTALKGMTIREIQQRPVRAPAQSLIRPSTVGAVLDIPMPAPPPLPNPTPTPAPPAG